MKEPPKLSDEDKKFIDNTVYCGGLAPIHIYVLKDEKKVRVDFISPAHQAPEGVYMSVGTYSFAVVEGDFILPLIRALVEAYQKLHHKI